jgi:myo-inositol 2-dehydrogenase / D-chiro-inositol 1-dehydrogenase
MSETPAASRRDFLKTSTAAALSAGLASQLVLPRAFASGDDTIKLGLVGCGGRGRGAAEQALRTSGNVKLVALGDVFEDHLNSAHEGLANTFKNQAGRVDVPPEKRFVGFNAYQKVIDSGIDLVILASPPGFRPIHFAEAVTAGKHVFMEKPVAVDVPGVRLVLEAVKESKKRNLKVGVGLQRHHQPPYLEALKRLRDGELGDIIAMRCYWNQAGVWDPRKTREEVSGEMEYQMRNWYYYTWLSGDHICEQHIHNLDVCNWWKDSYPIRAEGMGGRQVRTDKKFGEIFDHHAVEFEYDDGTRLFSYCRHQPNTWNSVSEHLHGTKGELHCDGRNASIVPRGADGKSAWKYPGPHPDPYQVEHDDLFAAIRNNTPYNEGENGARSTMTAILGRLATYSGKVIELKDAMASDVNLLPEKFTWDAMPKVIPLADGSYPIPMPGVTKVL